jgi:hypothetical protein
VLSLCGICEGVQIDRGSELTQARHTFMHWPIALAVFVSRPATASTSHRTCTERCSPSEEAAERRTGCWITYVQLKRPREGRRLTATKKQTQTTVWGIHMRTTSSHPKHAPRAAGEREKGVEGVQRSAEQEECKGEPFSRAWSQGRSQSQRTCPPATERQRERAREKERKRERERERERERDPCESP